MNNSNCSNGLQPSTSNNLHEASSSELALIQPSVNNQNKVANFIGFNIIEFPPEIHIEMCKYLDSQSMKHLRLTCKRLRDNVSIIDARIKENKERLEKELKEAIDTGSRANCIRIRSMLKKGVTLPLWKLTPYLKGAMMMDGDVSVTIVRALRRMGATLPLEDLPQTLRGVLRRNTAAAVQWNVKLLQEMGATLPHEELADELRGALRTDSFVASGRAIALVNIMGVTLPPVELPEFMQSAVNMLSPVGVLHAQLIKSMMGAQPQR